MVPWQLACLEQQFFWRHSILEWRRKLVWAIRASKRIELHATVRTRTKIGCIVSREHDELGQLCRRFTDRVQREAFLWIVRVGAINLTGRLLASDAISAELAGVSCPRTREQLGRNA